MPLDPDILAAALAGEPSGSAPPYSPAILAAALAGEPSGSAEPPTPAPYSQAMMQQAIAEPMPDPLPTAAGRAPLSGGTGNLMVDMQIAQAVRNEDPSNVTGLTTNALEAAVRTAHGGELPAGLVGKDVTPEPGWLHGLMRVTDAADFAVFAGTAAFGRAASFVNKPLSRVIFSYESAKQDLNDLWDIDPTRRREFLTAMAPDDPRRGAFERAIRVMDTGDKDSEWDKDRAEFAALSLFPTYLLPNIADPYGGTDLPHPPRPTDRGISQRRDTTDLILGLAGIDTDHRDVVRREMQYAMVPARDAAVAAIGALGVAKAKIADAMGFGDADIDPTSVMLGDSEGSPQHRGVIETYRARMVELGATRDERIGADPTAGLLALELLATVSPDLALARSSVPRAIATSFGRVTATGDKALAAATVNAAEEAVAKVAAIRPLSPIAEKVLRQDVERQLAAAVADVATQANKAGEIVTAVDLSRAVNVANDGTITVARDLIDKTVTTIPDLAGRSPVAVAKWLREVEAVEDAGLFRNRGAAVKAADAVVGYLAATLPGGQVIEYGRAAFGKGAKYLVRDLDGRLAPPDPTSVLDEHQVAALRAAIRQVARDRAEIGGLVNGALGRAFKGARTAEDVRLLTKFAEVTGHAASEDGVVGGVVRGVREALAGLARVAEPVAAEKLGQAGSFDRALDLLLGQTADDIAASAPAVMTELNNITRAVLGVATPEEARHIVAAAAAFRGSMVKAVSTLAAPSWGSVREAVAGKTVGDLLAAERAIASGVGEVPAHLREGVDAGREYFKQMHELLKAEGVLPPDHSYAVFVERMGVDGYVRHMLSGEGSQAIKRRFGALSTKLDAALRRKHAGSVDAINDGKRQDLARMVLGLNAGDGTTEELAKAVKEFGFDKFKFFEDDFTRILDGYSRSSSKAVANRRMIKTVRSQFPQGDYFAGLDPKALALAGGKSADEIARAHGYRQLRGAALVQQIPGIDGWHGWGSFRSQIDGMLQQFPPGKDRTDNVLRFLENHGLPVTTELREAATSVLARDTYLPMQAADMVEDMLDPATLDMIKHPILGAGLAVYDALTNFFKSSVTVNTIAFHGRNAISNAVQNLLVHGADTLRPSVIAMGIAIRTADDGTVLTHGGITRTAKEWREAAVRHGVQSDLIQITEQGRSVREHMISVPGAIKVGAATGAASAAAYMVASDSEEGPEFRYALGAALLGGFLGVSGKANYDALLSRAVQTGLAEKSWDAAYRMFMHDSMDLLADSGKVAAGGAAAGAIVGGPVGAAIGGAALGGARFALEGSTIVGGSIGREIEGQARLAGWLSGIRKGLGEAGAADLVNRALFDYGDLTNFERSAMRRVFPFYIWTSKNVGAQAWLAANRPAQYAAMVRFVDGTSRGTLTPDDMAIMDEHLRYRWALGTGLGRMAAAGILPIEAFAELTKMTSVGNVDRVPNGILQMVNPSIKIPFEWIADLSLYYNRPISSVRGGRELVEAPKVVQDFLGYETWVDEKGREHIEIGRYRDASGQLLPDVAKAAKRLYLIRNAPPYRLVTELTKAVNKTYMSGVQELAGEPATVTERMLNIGIGFKTYQFDQEAKREMALSRWERALTDDLGRLGLAQQVHAITASPLQLE